MHNVKSWTKTKVLLLVLPFLLVGCGGSSDVDVDHAPEPVMETEPIETDAMPASTSPQVSFVSPENGGTYSADSPVPFEFGIENYELAAVPEEVDQARMGMGHHHLGLNTDCLAEGEVIPRGDPSWVHFGDASDTIDMMLEPGEHTFVLQLGDDEHRTQAENGLCASVTFRVEEGI